MDWEELNIFMMKLGYSSPPLNSFRELHYSPLHRLITLKSYVSY